MANKKSFSDSIRPLSEVVDAPQEVINASREGDLVLFIGAGVSRLLGLPSWKELAEEVLKDIKNEFSLSYSGFKQLENLDPKQQLSIAERIMGRNYLENSIVRHLKSETRGDNIYRFIKNIGCSYVTTNYDELLLPCAKHVFKKEQFSDERFNTPGTVVHLHGCISKPDTMVVTTKDYLEHYTNDNVQDFLKEMFAKKTVVFFGYGLEELEILEYILSRREFENTNHIMRFTVQGFLSSEQFLRDKLRDYYKETFDVHLLGFALDEKGPQVLEETVQIWSAQINVPKPSLLEKVKIMEKVFANG